MAIPKIVEHKIIRLKKPSGLTQYFMTLPKEFGENISRQGIESLFIIYNQGLGAFPKIEGLTEEALLTFMKKHPELQKLFAETTKKEG